MEFANPTLGVREFLAGYAEFVGCPIKQKRLGDDIIYLANPSTPIRRNHPTWFNFAVGGEGDDADLLVRAESAVGKLTNVESIADAMSRHFSDPDLVFAIVHIQKAPYLFAVQDFLVPLVVGQESLDARLSMALILNSVSAMHRPIRGLDCRPDVLQFAVHHHQPYQRTVRVTPVDVSVAP